MSDSAVFGISFALQDLFSDVAGKIESKMQSLTNQGEGLANKLNKAFSGLTTGLGLLAVGGMLTAGIGDVLKEAAKFSDLSADIRKTTGATVEEVQKLDASFQNLDTRTGLDGLFEIAKFGGSIGVTVSEMESFTKATDQAVVALGDEFGGGIEGIVKPLGTVKTLFKETKDLDFGSSITKIGSAINQLGSEGTATGGVMADFTSRIGQLGNLAPSVTQTLGLGAALQELGLTSEIAAGGVTNIMLTAGQNISAFSKQVGMTTNEFKQLMNTDPNKMFLTLAKSMQGMSNSQVIETMKKLKIGSQESIKVMSLLANQTELVEKRQLSASEAFQKGTSLSSEFDLKNNNLAAGMEKASKQISILAKNFGEALEPAVMPLFAIFTNITKALSDFFQTSLGKGIAKLIAGFAMFITTLGATMVIVNGAKLAFTIFAPTIWASVTAMGAFLVSMLPFIAIGLAVYGAFEFINKSLSKFNTYLMEGLTTMNPITYRMIQFGGILRGVYHIFESLNNEGFTLPENINNALQRLGILDLVVSIGTYIVRAKSFLEGFGGAFTGFVSQVSAVFTPFFAFLKNVFLDLFKTILNVGRGFERAQDPLTNWSEAGASLANYVLVPLQWALKGISFVLDIFRGIISFSLGVIQGFASKLEWVSTAFGFVVQSLQPAITWFNSLNTTTDSAGNKMQWLIDIGRVLGTVLSGILTGALYLVGGAVQLVIGFVGTLVNAFTFLFNLVRDGFNFIANSPIVDKISGLLGSIGGGIGAIADFVSPTNDPQGVGKVATQMSDMRANSGQAMSNFEAQTVKNKQAETLARTPQVTNTNNNNVNVSSTPVVLQLDSQVIGKSVIDYMSNQANN